MIYGTSIQVTDVPDIRFAAQRSRCRHKSSKQCMLKDSLDVEANSTVQYIRRHFSEGWLYDFEKPKHTNAPQRHNTLQTMAIEVRQGQAAAARQMAHGAAASLRITAVLCVCARGGKTKKIPPKLETTSGEEIPCPGLSLRLGRSGRNTPFRWIFQSWKLSEPTFVSTCCVHRSCCRRILYRSRRKHPLSVGFFILEIARTKIPLHMQCTQILLFVGESCTDQHLWPTSGHHKQWPYSREEKNGNKGRFSFGPESSIGHMKQPGTFCLGRGGCPSCERKPYDAPAAW